MANAPSKSVSTNYDEIIGRIEEAKEDLLKHRHLKRENFMKVINRLEEINSDIDIYAQSKKVVLDEVYSIDEDNDRKDVHQQLQGYLSLRAGTVTLNARLEPDYSYGWEGTRSLSPNDCTDDWLNVIIRDGALMSLLQNYLEELKNESTELEEHQITAPNLVEPSTDLVVVAEKFGYSTVLRHWRQANTHLSTNPSTALTQAGALLESTCKHILDDLSVDYKEVAKGQGALVKLTKKTATSLEKSNNKPVHTLAGTVGKLVNPLAQIRNDMSDAHGKGPHENEPTKNEARLFVHLAGSLATFFMHELEGIRRAEAAPQESNQEPEDSDPTSS